MKKLTITLTLPLLEMKKDSEYYGLIIKDSSKIYHYFNKDGAYDGKSMENKSE